MRTVALAILVLSALKSYSQHNLYTFNNGNFIEEDTIKLHFDAVKKTLPSTHMLTAVIYHKIAKKDTVLNYISLSISRQSSAGEPASFKLEYKQDSVFLLLDQKLPAFRLMDMEGKEISSAALSGKPTLINFWATYCGPCIAEMPYLSRLKEKYKDKMNFISITENSIIDDRLHEFLKDKDFNFQVLERGETYKNELKIGALPKNLFLDRNGIVRYIQPNYPIGANSAAVAIDDKNNYFTKIIEELIRDSR